MKLVGRRSASVVAVCVYRPPGAVTATFINQLSDLLDQLVLLDLPFVIAGDFNVPGDVEGLDSRTADVFLQYGLRQHVSCADRQQHPRLGHHAGQRHTARPAGIRGSSTVSLLL